MSEPVEAWLLPVLWRERDWRAALTRLATEKAKVPASAMTRRSAVELGRACEYIEPDRRRAVAAYELAGNLDAERARELAIETGWWAARARRGARADDDIVDEAEAWWDAREPELAMLALAGLRGTTDRASDLHALSAGTDRPRHAERIAARAATQTGAAAAADYVMAARVAHAIRNLEAALAACPGHPIAARMLLDHALTGRDAEPVQRVVRACLAGLDPTATVDALRMLALALVRTDQHRGFGLRLLRQALDTAYEAHLDRIPGHLAMWITLVERATADGTRRELLPLAIHAIECSPHPIDHVWLGALATQISLDAGSPVVAGAYAEIVAEHAPEHPIVKQLVTDVASAGDAVPVEAVAAANTVRLELDVDVPIEETYADAVVRKKPPPPPPKKSEPKPEPKQLARSSIIPAVLTKSAPKPVAPVLAALRTPNRPLIPPKIEPAQVKERARRTSVPIDVRLLLDSGPVLAHSRDLSTSGMFVLTGAPLVVGSTLDLVVMVPGTEAFTEDEHHARVRVVRRGEGGYGVELIAPDAELLGALAAL